MSEAGNIVPVRPPAEPLVDPLGVLNTPSRAMTRRIDVALAVFELTEAAREAGWHVTSDTAYSKGATRYLQLEITSKVKITLRVSDHLPSRPLGIEGDRPFLLAIIDTPGGISHARNWLVRVGNETLRVLRGETHPAAIRTADHQRGTA